MRLLITYLVLASASIAVIGGPGRATLGPGLVAVCVSFLVLAHLFPALRPLHSALYLILVLTVLVAGASPTATLFTGAVVGGFLLTLLAIWQLAPYEVVTEYIDPLGRYHRVVRLRRRTRRLEDHDFTTPSRW